MSADFSTRTRAESSPRLVRLGVVIGALLLAASAGQACRAVAARSAARSELATRQADLAELRRRLGPLERPSSPEATLRRQVELTARASPPRVLADLATLVPPGAALDRVVLDYTDELGLELRVEARTPADYDRLLEALRSSDRLKGVLPGPETREGDLTATVTAVYRPGGQP